MTRYDESSTGLMVPRSYGSNGHNPTAGYSAMVDILESRLGDLERQIAEQGWGRLDGSAGKEFSRDALDSIVELSRVMYLKNPIINRAVEIGALYVWGQDLSHSTEDEAVEAVVDRFWKDNRATLTGQQASRLVEVELQCTGNLFFALFPDKITGSVRVRGVPMEEIRQIISNPDDRTDIWYYRRTWTEQEMGGTATERTAYYPDWRYRPANKPDTVNDLSMGTLEVRWDSPVVHVKSGAFMHWRWGVPEIYAALDWAKAYKEQLEDDATRSRALARFAWQLTTKGGKPGVAAAKTKLGTTYGTANSVETNPPPTSASTFISTEGIDLNPIKVAGATLDPDHSRPARLMASAALGIPDHFFDSDVGNYATSKTLDRPTELRFNERRNMWRDTLGDLIQWVIDRDLEATRGILPKSLPADARAVDLTWPDLLESDAVARVQAVATASPFLPDDLVSRLMMSALSVDDIDSEMEKMDAGTGTEKPQEQEQETPTESIAEAKRKRMTDEQIKRAVRAWDAVAGKAAGLLDAEIVGEDAA
jgi:hypothetical protein